MQLILIAIDGVTDLHAKELILQLPVQLEGASLKQATHVITLDNDTKQSDILAAAKHVRNAARGSQAKVYDPWSAPGLDEAFELYIEKLRDTAKRARMVLS